jgi:hypothetical protein
MMAERCFAGFSGGSAPVTPDDRKVVRSARLRPTRHGTLQVTCRLTWRGRPETPARSDGREGTRVDGLKPGGEALEIASGARTHNTRRRRRARTLRRRHMGATAAGKRTAMPTMPGITDDTTWARHRGIVFSRRIGRNFSSYITTNDRSPARPRDRYQHWRPRDTGQLLHNLPHDPAHARLARGIIRNSFSLT